MYGNLTITVRFCLKDSEENEGEKISRGGDY